MKLMLSISTITSVAMVDNLLKLLIDGVVEHIQVDNLEMDCSMNSKNNLFNVPFNGFFQWFWDEWTRLSEVSRNRNVSTRDFGEIPIPHFCVFVQIGIVAIKPEVPTNAFNNLFPHNSITFGIRKQLVNSNHDSTRHAFYQGYVEQLTSVFGSMSDRRTDMLCYFIITNSCCNVSSRSSIALLIELINFWSAGATGSFETNFSKVNFTSLFQSK